MSWKIGMPNLGHTMEEGKVAEWLKKVGDRVAAGEAVVVVESDKANFDVESPADGVLLSIDVPEGDVVAVGATIGVIGAPGEAVEQDDRVGESVEKSTVVTDRGGAPASVGLPSMRRAIAEATTKAWQAIPHVALSANAEVGPLIAAKLPLTAAIGLAAGRALAEHKAFNSHYLAGELEPRDAIDIAFAMSTPRGVVTAVVKDTVGKTLASLHQDIQSSAEAAREGRLDGGRMVGGTFTISSLGRWGVSSFSPIISQPQIAILGVGKVDRVAREAAGGGLRFASEITLTLVFDHRASDGVEAAEFLAAIVRHLEALADSEAAG